MKQNLGIKITSYYHINFKKMSITLKILTRGQRKKCYDKVFINVDNNWN